MKKFGEAVVKLRVPILILSVLLLFPSAWGYFHTRVNYDILSYLPEDIETMKGQDILVDQFGTGAFSMVVVEGMDFKDVSKLKARIEEVDHVKQVIWYDSFVDLSVPVDLLPDKIRDAFLKGDDTVMAVIFDSTMSSDETMEAIETLRTLADRQCFISGMSAVVTDTKNVAEQETPIYVLLAVVLCSIVLALTMDSFLVPVFFLLSIGMAIIYNLGSNYFLGEISYITKALSAVLQLGVTLDYSIFLWHSYEEQQNYCEGDKKKAMANAIAATLTSVLGSSITTIAGFIALCFMSFTLGMDLGVVMAKGVVFGVIGCVTILPSMILIFDRWIEKTKHRPLLPNFKKIPAFVQKYYPVILILFVLIWIPAVKGYNNTQVYYDLADTLPDDLPGSQANQKLEELFHMNSTHMLLVDSSLEPKQVEKMCEEMKQVDGVKAIIGLDAMLGAEIPRDLIPSGIKEVLESDEYELMLISSEYKVASDEVNAQCSELNRILKQYDPTGMLVGEAPCTKDLIEITDQDFKTVSGVSIGFILIIVLLVYRSLSLPILLVAVIEFAIFINMGIPYYTGTVIPFIASVVIGTIQLGSTVDYAILMTARYRTERRSGKSRKEAVQIAHSTSIQSILVSAFSFFAATFGVGMYSEIDMISSLCTLLARGALVSMVVVIFVLPSVLLLCDRLIIYTSIGFRPRKEKVYIENHEEVLK